MEFTDRYQALGIPYPDPETMCKGPCEGTGVVPVKGARNDDPHMADCSLETDPELLRRWAEAEAVEHAEDGWHFVTCPDCDGTRLVSDD